ncbi:MAG: DUF2804 domain-containing protein [Treponema sp.]|nr:DUF2804 domain-containing protein [Treponema sp.]
MYTREIQEKRHSPLENGNPLQGTWIEAFDEVDLLNIHRPYKIPLIKKIKAARIKEWDSFIIQDDLYFLLARLCNFKYFRIALLTMYDIKTEKRLDIRKIIPGGGWHLPKGLYNDSVDSRSWGFFFRIHSWLDAESIKLELNIKRTLSRPALAAHAAFDLAAGKTTPMAVNLLFSERRNMYAFKALTAVEGDVVADGQHIHLNPKKTSGLFCDFKGYYPYRMRCTWCEGMGFDNQGRRFGFSMGENQAKEAYKNNENAFWLNGRLTPLPPVKITRSGGSVPEWIIQDMEGMVDLVFTPKVSTQAIANLIFTAYDYENPLGYFNGKLVSGEGEELPVHNVFGICEKLYLRV